VVPHRTPTGRRVYTEADIERLGLLREATTWGHAIGQIATLPVDQLRQLVRNSRSAADRLTASSEFTSPKTASKRKTQAAVSNAEIDDEITPEQLVANALEAVTALDAAALEHAFARASVLWSRPRVMDDVVVPFMQAVGEGWRDGNLRIGHEHLASAVVRTHLGDMIRSTPDSLHAPVLLVTTPTGQMHEIGALMAAAVAAFEGWRVIYLGPNLPAEEIAAAALRGKAKAVALSLVYPADDPNLRRELLKMRELLPASTLILTGGSATSAYESTLKSISALRLHTLIDLRHTLESLRQKSAPH
jgi:methanogenic corrinoid protein MtbC1